MEREMKALKGVLLASAFIMGGMLVASAQGTGSSGDTAVSPTTHCLDQNGQVQLKSAMDSSSSGSGSGTSSSSSGGSGTVGAGSMSRSGSGGSSSGMSRSGLTSGGSSDTAGLLPCNQS